MRKSYVYELVLAAMFAVIMTICAWITIPFAVPFTMQTFGVFLAIAVLGGKLAALSIFLYILLGAIGIPVFSGFQSGIGVLFGNTGGYVIGFLVAALMVWGLETCTEKVKMKFVERDREEAKEKLAGKYTEKAKMKFAERDRKEAKEKLAGKYTEKAKEKFIGKCMKEAKGKLVDKCQRFFGGSSMEKRTWLIAVELFIGLLVCYAFGTIWFWMLYMRNSGAISIGAVIGICVVPFLIPDIVKILLVLAVRKRLRKILQFGNSW